MSKIFRLKNKGWVAGIIFLLLIFALPGLKSRAAAAYVVDYKDEIVYIKAGEHQSLYFAFAETGKEAKNFVPVLKGAIVKTDKFGGEAEDAFCIDLSAQSFKKATNLVFRFDDETATETIAFETRKVLKAVYCGIEKNTGELALLYPESKFTNINRETGYFQFYLDDVAQQNLDTKIEWRAGTAMSYRNITELNLNLYFDRGATLYFRSNDGSSHISKESKVKIKKMSNPPSVKVDGSKMSIALKETQEYRIVVGSQASDWVSGLPGEKYLALKDMNLPSGDEASAGDGNFKAYTDLVIEIRTKATEKNHSSRITGIALYAVEKPKEGADGVELSQVNLSDIKKGLLVTNNSNENYQVAIIEKPEGKSLKAALLELDANVKRDEAGYVSWKNLNAGSKLTLSYTMFKDFADYWVLYRKAPVKEDSKTAEIEFRTASVIRAFGGNAPVCDAKGGAILMEGDSATKLLNFTVDESSDLYVSVNGAAFVKNTSGQVSITGNPGDNVLVKAYSIDTELNEQSSVITLNFKFVRGGELPDYKNKWGYSNFKKLDAQKNSNSRQILYQRIYLAYTTYDESVNWGDLTDLTAEDLNEVMCAVRADNPILIQAKSSYSWTRSSVNLFYNNKAECDQLLTQCNNSLAKIEANIIEKYGSVAQASKVQIVKEIHDFIILKKEYKNSAYAQTMAGALADAYTPVCMSYALAFKYCCEHFGIQCELIFGDAKNSSGRSESHAWNIVNYGENVDYESASAADYHTDNWYEMDVTWDDPVGPGEDYIGYRYFNITTDQMSENHFRNFGFYSAYPFDKCTGSELSYNNCLTNNLFE